MIAVAVSLLGFFLFGVAVLWYQRLVRPARPNEQDAVSNAKSMTGWLIVYLTLQLVTGPFVVILIGMMILNRIGERRSFLWTLAVAAEKQIPLSVAARSFALDRRDDFGSRAIAFADAIDTGAPIDAALKRAHIRLPVSASLAIDIGDHQNEGLSRSLLSAVKHDSNLSGVMATLLDRGLYLLLTFAVLVQIVTFTCVFLVPTFRQIFDDFNTELPAITELMISIAGTIENFAPLITLALVSLGFFIGYDFLRWTGVPLPQLPGMPRSWARAIYGPTVLRSIAQAVDMKSPIAERLQNIAEHFSVRHISRRMKKVADAAGQGGCWIDAMLQQKLVSRNDTALLKSAQQLGNLSWAINEIADRQTQRFSHRVNVLIEWLSPLPTILLAIPVGFFAIAMILPLTTLVQNLSL